MCVYITQLDVHSDNKVTLMEKKFKPLAYLDCVSNSNSYRGIILCLAILIRLHWYWCAWFRLDLTYFGGCNVAF